MLIAKTNDALVLEPVEVISFEIVKDALRKFLSTIPNGCELVYSTINGEDITGDDIAYVLDVLSFFEIPQTYSFLDAEALNELDREEDEEKPLIFDNIEDVIAFLSGANSKKVEPKRPSENEEFLKLSQEFLDILDELEAREKGKGNR